MALYGVSILFVGLVLAASLANYHFGTNLSTFVLCEWSSARLVLYHSFKVPSSAEWCLCMPAVWWVKDVACP